MHHLYQFKGSNFKYILKVTYGLLLFSLITLIDCNSNLSSPKDYGTWSFSGHVIDGYSQTRLPNVSIAYLNNNGESKVVITDSSGEFIIQSLPFGDRSFRFSVNRTNQTSPAYTQKIIQVSSYNESRSIDGLVGDISKIVTLYPLTSSVSGSVFVKLSGSEKTIPASGVDVAISYKDTNLTNSSPSAFVSTTDSSGLFNLSSIPVAPGASLSINNCTVNGKIFSSEPLSLTTLFNNKTLNVGKIYLTEKDTSSFLINRVKSNVLSADGFGLTNISPDIKLWYVLPLTPIPSSIEVTINGGGSDVNAVVRVSGDTIFTDASKKLAYDSLITVSITGLDTAKNLISFVFDGVKRFRIKKELTTKIISNVLSADGFGLTNVPVNIKPWYVLPFKILKTGLDVSINGGGNPGSTFRVNGDTVFITPLKNFSYDTLVTISITGTDSANNYFKFVFDNAKQFKTEKDISLLVKSNTFTADGFGISGIPVNATIWYVLPVKPHPSSIEAFVSGSGSLETSVRVIGDTVFIYHAKDFNYDTEIGVTIMGMDTARNHLLFTFDGIRQFRTEKNIFPVASNTWPKSGVAKKNFKLGDTLWVKFSEILDTDLNKFAWEKTAAFYAIYGKGSSTNANVWVNADTLFLQPDQRIAIDYSQTMGFKVCVTALSGKRSDTLDFVVNTIENNYYVKWTNTKDYLGNVRQDFGTLDSIFIVSNSPIAQIIGLSGVTGKTSPLDLTLSNVSLRGDTIVYKPSLFLKPDSTYGIDFDILFKDGNLRRDILGVSWKIASRVQIISIDNKSAGTFRPFKVIGDSLTVVFSEPIDTNSNAAIPFRVNMVDVKYRLVNTRVSWDATCKIAKIFNTDTLPSADFDASPAYTSDATLTKAVKSVSFNLVTKSGEQIINLQPKNETIEIHTERGLCVVDANVLLNHDSHYDVEKSENTVDNFPSDAAVRITFNRAIDTSSMKADTNGLSKFAFLKEGTTPVISAVSFSTDAKTIIIAPSVVLKPLSNYYIILRDIPGFGIRGAQSISKDGGTFSGRSSTPSSYQLLDKSFMTR
jgi:hypothetical protein